jgi:hypothetical protein
MESNVFRIKNLSELSARYRLHRVKGLMRDQRDYYRNLGFLVNRLSRELRSPVTFTEQDGLPFLAIPEDSAEPEPHYLLVGHTAHLEKSLDVLTIDFTRLDEETTPLALRFLQFCIQGSLWKKNDLWQPSTGRPFFEKKAHSLGNGVGMHCGFAIRAMAMEDGIGLCLDVTHKYVSVRPLPTYLSSSDFQQFKMRHAVYRMCHDWFEIRLAERSELSVAEVLFPYNGKQVNLLQRLQQHDARPLPPEVVGLPRDSSVVHYYNGRDELRAAPSALCYLILETDAQLVARRHGRSLIPPEERRSQISDLVRKYLSNLTLGDIRLRVTSRPIHIPRRSFSIPDTEFGGGKILSVKGAPGAIHTTLNALGQHRLNLLRDKSAGFFVKEPLQRQFFFMPQTIQQSWGPEFLRQLQRAVDTLYPQDDAYEPELITYDDRKGTTFVDQGLAIKAAAAEDGAKEGYAVVMIHDPSDRKRRQQDQLAAYVMQTLFEGFDIRVAVMHTEVGSECYRLRSNAHGQLIYAPVMGKSGKLNGYLRNVALSKVLLNNEKWPFVLAEQPHAELMVVVDVKAHHVGLTVIGQGARYICTHIGKCRFAERIETDEFRNLVVDAVCKYCSTTGLPPRTILLVRDGRMYQPELMGMHRGLKFLQVNGYARQDTAVTCVELPKRSLTPFRLFDVRFDKRCQGGVTHNPTVGQYYTPNRHEGYVCATGVPFYRPGSVNPLHVKKIDGTLSIEHCLEDVFWYTMLAWTRPEDCTRYPIGLKLNDRRLFEDAGEYDEHQIEVHEQEINP